MAKSLKTSVSAKNNIRKPLTLVDVECPVCRDIFIEPVTLPCKHCFCLQCFDGTMESVSLQCPMCRTRVGGWLRTATKDNRVVDIKLWELIQRDFSEYVKAKLRGEEKQIEEEVRPICISKPGEVRQEYEMQKMAMEEETRKQRDKDTRASSDLIQKLQEEENMEIAKKTMKIKRSLALDEEIARKLMLEEMNRFNRTSPSGTAKKSAALSSESKGSSIQPNRTENKENKALKSTSSTVKGPMDIFLGKKKASFNIKKLVPIGSSGNVKAHSKIDKMADGEKDRSASGLSTGSCDSINQEMHHFKPIKVAPRTPPKQMPDGRIIEPKVVKITPVHLSCSYDDKTGKVPLQNCAMSTSQLDSKYQSSRTNVVRELFQTGKTSSEPRGPSAFCGTGVLESDICCESGSKNLDPDEPKIQKIDSSEVIVQGCGSEESPKGDDLKVPLRRRKRKIPCSGGADDEAMPCEDTAKGRRDESGMAELDLTLELSGVTKEVLEEQFRREAQLHQEQKDLELAKQLQKEWEREDRRIDRRRGSHLEYELRSRLPSQSRDAKRKPAGKSKRKSTMSNRVAEGGPRQQSLEEVMSCRAKLNKGSGDSKHSQW